MKKLSVLLFLMFFAFQTYAQKGDLHVGAIGGYITKYKDVVYGLSTSYHLSDPLEISLTGLMNPNITQDNDIYGKSKLKLYSVSTDLRFYMLLQRTWAMGPFIGGQYLYANTTDLNSSAEISNKYSTDAFGFNIGWHMRANLTDNIKLNGGWRYTSASQEMSHHMFYIGLGYTFNLY